MSVLGLLTTTITALRPVEVTAGWTDQSLFHLPTVLEMVRELPTVDIVDVDTATGPLYHLSLAIPARIFGLPPAVIQILGGWLVLTVLGAVVIWAGRGMPWASRSLLAVAVIASPYVWQSVLWIATDTAALALGLAALVMLTRLDGSMRPVLAAGAAIALAIAVRQTFAWLLLPALVAGLSTGGRHRRTRTRDVAVLCVPGTLVLVGLVVAWRGLAPPGFEDGAAGIANPAAISYGFGLWAVFAVPLLVAVTTRRLFTTRHVLAAATVGLLAASPAVIWPSGYDETDSIREGGWLWLVVKATGDLNQRSSLLVVLAFLGAAALVLLLFELAVRRDGAIAAVIGLSVVVGILAAVPATQAFQKYYEIPLLICYFAAATALRPGVGNDLRQAPFAGPAILQLLALGAIVGLPVAGALL